MSGEREGRRAGGREAGRVGCREEGREQVGQEEQELARHPAHDVGLLSSSSFSELVVEFVRVLCGHASVDHAVEDVDKGVELVRAVAGAAEDAGKDLAKADKDLDASITGRVADAKPLHDHGAVGVVGTLGAKDRLAPQAAGLVSFHTPVAVPRAHRVSVVAALVPAHVSVQKRDPVRTRVKARTHTRHSKRHRLVEARVDHPLLELACIPPPSSSSSSTPPSTMSSSSMGLATIRMALTVVSRTL